MLTYTSDELCALSRHDVTPPRHVRQTIFSLWLWKPKRQRRYAQRHAHLGFSHSESIDASAALCVVVNARSVGNKSALLCCMIVDSRLDLLLITETWHENSESVSLKRVTPTGFKCAEAARTLPSACVHSLELQNYGGIALIYRSDFKVVRHQLDVTPSTFELLCISVATGSKSLLLLGVYRPGSKAVTAEFFDELTSVLEISVEHRTYVICGDLNIHLDDVGDANAARLIDLLQTFNCVQHVSEPTHLAGHILDVVISRADTDIRRLSVDDFVSDHACSASL